MMLETEGPGERPPGNELTPNNPPSGSNVGNSAGLGKLEVRAVPLSTSPARMPQYWVLHLVSEVTHKKAVRCERCGREFALWLGASGVLVPPFLVTNEVLVTQKTPRAKFIFGCLDSSDRISGMRCTWAEAK